MSRRNWKRRSDTPRREIANLITGTPHRKLTLTGGELETRQDEFNKATKGKEGILE
jgi:hypothetical protein